MEVEVMKFKLLVLLVLFLLIPATSALSFDTINPEEAYEIVTTDANAFILDVRTFAEWRWVGHPGENGLGEGADLNGKVINIAYFIEKKGQFPVLNGSFLNDVDEFFEDYPDVTLITMCREGIRGAFAAAFLEKEENGGYNVMNMGEAFQGTADARGYRTENGWVVRGLPYTNAGPGYQD
jgi:rhodanese-related sulfurtransferase